MKVRLLNDTIVRFAKGSVLEVSEQEASRLIAFRNAEPIEEPEKKPATKTARTRKPKQ